MAAALQHEAATLSPWIQVASNGKHHPHGTKTNDALKFKPDQSAGAGQEGLVPVLQRRGLVRTEYRGLVRTEYTGNTLRETLHEF